MGSAELYDKDFAEWTRHNAELLRAGRTSEADLEHIAEEIEDLGKRERRGLHNRMVLKRMERAWDVSAVIAVTVAARRKDRRPVPHGSKR